MRVQSRVTEEPVEEQVRLREEHARAVTVTVGHSLGKDEAVRRLKHGFARTHGQLGSVIAMDQETWEGDSLRFRVRALGQTATGSAGGRSPHRTVLAFTAGTGSEMAASNIAQQGDAAPG